MKMGNLREKENANRDKIKDQICRSLLEPLLVPVSYGSVSMIALPKSEGKSSIMATVDQFSKYVTSLISLRLRLEMEMEVENGENAEMGAMISDSVVW